MQKIGWGIVGYGVIGKTHARAVTRAPDAELLAVCDINPACEKVLREQGYKTPFYGSLKEMLRQQPDIQAVSICTPSGLHYRGALEAARAGRHVLSEKPLDITLNNMDRMIDGCEKAGVKLGCIFQRRTQQVNILARQALRRKLLGKMVMGDCYQKYYRSPAYYRTADWRGTWKLDGGGALMNQAVHGIDLLLWMMGDVESVFTYSGTLVRKIEVEDTSVTVVRFKNGALGNIVGTTSVVPGQSCELMLHGERGSIFIKGDESRCYIGKEVKGVHKPEEITLEKLLGVKSAAGPAKAKTSSVASDNTALSLGGHTLQVQDLCQAIRRNREPMITGRDARRAVELILAIYRSWKTRKEVKLPLK